MYAYSRNTRQKRQHHVQKTHNARARRAHGKVHAETGEPTSAKDGRVHDHWDHGRNVKRDHVIDYWNKRKDAWDKSLKTYIRDCACAVDDRYSRKLRGYHAYMERDVPEFMLRPYVLSATRNPYGKNFMSLCWLFRREPDVLRAALTHLLGGVPFALNAMITGSSRVQYALDEEDDGYVEYEEVENANGNE